jgi:hypothetical protein
MSSAGLSCATLNTGKPHNMITIATPIVFFTKSILMVFLLRFQVPPKDGSVRSPVADFGVRVAEY